MPGFTNKGKVLLFGPLRAIALPTNLYIALVTDAAVPDEDTNVLSDLTEVTAGNGYTAGGYQLTPGVTDFDTLNEDDVLNIGQLLVKDVVWTASGGTLPDASSARYAVLTNDDGTVADREIYFFWDLVSNQQVADGNDFTLRDLEMRITE